MVERRKVRFKMRVIDNDSSEFTLTRILMNSVIDTHPKDDVETYIPGEPQGSVRFNIKDREIAELFVQGQDYYVEFEPTFQEKGSKDAGENL